MTIISRFGSLEMGLVMQTNEAHVTMGLWDMSTLTQARPSRHQACHSLVLTNLAAMNS